MAIAYAVAGWLLIQVATQVFPFFNIPNWSVRLTVLLIVIGFPIAVVLAWAFEITPEGVRRTEPAHSPDAREAHETHAVARKLNIIIIIAILILAVALLGWRLLVVQHGEASLNRSPDAAQRNPGQTIPDSTVGAVASGLHKAQSATPAAFNPPADTLVVLSFANESDDPKQQYFSDGITEELTNALALIAAGRLTYQSLLDPKLHAQALSTVGALRRRTDLDPSSLADVLQLEMALGQNPTALEQLPKFCATIPVACSDLSVNPVWIPLRSDPRFQALVKQYDTVSAAATASSP